MPFYMQTTDCELKILHKPSEANQIFNFLQKISFFAIEPFFQRVSMLAQSAGGIIKIKKAPLELIAFTCYSSEGGILGNFQTAKLIISQN